MGPTKGGIRYHEDVNLGEVPALAMWITWKCTLMELPFGDAVESLRRCFRVFDAQWSKSSLLAATS